MIKYRGLQVICEFEICDDKVLCKYKVCIMPALLLNSVGVRVADPLDAVKHPHITLTPQKSNC